MSDFDFFDALAPHWDASETESTPEKVAEMLQRMGVERGMSVLDLGTGTGVLLAEIARRVGPEGKIVAIDGSAGMLAIAREKVRGLLPAPEFLQLDFEQQSVEGRFDRVLLYCVYPHLHEPVATLRRLVSDNLTPSGSVMIAFPTDANFIDAIHAQRHADSDRCPTPGELAADLVEAGFKTRVLADEEHAYIVEVR